MSVSRDTVTVQRVVSFADIVVSSTHPRFLHEGRPRPTLGQPVRPSLLDPNRLVGLLRQTTVLRATLLLYIYVPDLSLTNSLVILGNVLPIKDNQFVQAGDLLFEIDPRTYQPALALVDTASFWVHGYFRETMIGRVAPGDRAVVTLMSYPDQPLQGRVDSIGWGISQSDGGTGSDLLPTVSRTFEWIRLAQRIPVRVHLDEIPDGVELRVGTTGSVLVMTGTANGDGDRPVPAVPQALQ